MLHWVRCFSGFSPFKHKSFRCTAVLIWKAYQSECKALWTTCTFIEVAGKKCHWTFISNYSFITLSRHSWLYINAGSINDIENAFKIHMHRHQPQNQTTKPALCGKSICVSCYWHKKSLASDNSAGGAWIRAEAISNICKHDAVQCKNAGMLCLFCRCTFSLHRMFYWLLCFLFESFFPPVR